MDTKEDQKYIEYFAKNNIFIVKNIMNVNHKPHPYMVGPRHVAHAADKHNGRLGEETLKAIPCSDKGCTFPYEEHTSDKVLFIQLTGNAENEVANKEIKGIAEMLKADKIDGIAMVDTSEKYRIESKK